MKTYNLHLVKPTQGLTHIFWVNCIISAKRLGLIFHPLEYIHQGPTRGHLGTNLDDFIQRYKSKGSPQDSCPLVLQSDASLGGVEKGLGGCS